ncbi:MAG: T9SS type A sorting domain-containing protein [bacterium]
MKMMRKYFIPAACVVLLFITFISSVLADSIPGVPAANKVLIIYTTNGIYNTSLKDDIVNTLNLITPVPMIEYVTVAASSGAGFYDELVAQTGKTNLSTWCQVWDLRFSNTYVNAGAPCSTADNICEEKISLGAGATTDQTLFRNFLLQGGGLFLQGEHQERPCRNQSIISFANTVANTAIGVNYSGVIVIAGGLATITPSAYGNFSTDFNTLSGQITTQWPGGIATGNLGSATSLITVPLAGPYSILMGYMPAALNTAAGNLVISWDSGTYMLPQKNAVSDMIIQNTYDFLSNGSCIFTTPTMTETYTPLPTLTVTETITQTATPTITATMTETSTSTFTPTITMTATNLPTATVTATATPDFSFTLVTVYPNPSSDKNWIVYDLTRDADVTITIFTISGEKIWTKKEHQGIGRMRTEWPGKNTTGQEVASGVYMFSIQAVSGKDKSKLIWGRFAMVK